MRGVKGWCPLLLFDVQLPEHELSVRHKSPISAPKRKETRLIVKGAEAVLSQRPSWVRVETSGP